MTKAEQLAQLFAQLEEDLPTLPLGNIGEPTVPGDGDPDSPIMFIGEAPGYNESVQRRPFVGRSGQYFIKTLEEVGWPRAKVYISNIVKVRPPDNRDPSPAEILAYKPYLDREIAILAPKLIVTLGRFSMAKFLHDVRISQVHGRVHRVDWEGKLQYVMPSFHPAAVLRNPEYQRAFAADFAKIPKVLEWISSAKQDDDVEIAVKSALL